ncbi:sigma-70 family RNA polymerase sigma factor [Streptosporangiaceae bacterium NEAU-GS5]|nr:sigma-70 family RNA polymerase sigma factor [Streptosporangiaceae bacterium NEAU-GS5]
MTSISTFDPGVWQELVARFDGRMWSVARAHGLNPADAADAVQGAWLRMIESLDGIRDPEAIGAWLLTTTRREAVRLCRKARGELPADVDPPEVTEPDPALAVVDADVGREMWRRLATLGEPCQTLLRLYVLNPDVRYGQIAARLGIPVGSVGPAKARCLAKLRVLAHDLL